MKKILISILFILILISGSIYFWFNYTNDVETEIIAEKNELKLYWFIPDGLRNDPDTFNMYLWAEQGYLPNIKKLMDKGSYGYSIPTFPGHTPTNFATLLTGTYPEKNGVADGPMHVEGKPLNQVAIGGFSSTAKKVDPIWVTLEDEGEKVLLLSIPGSTPPELEKGITIRGRWGGWGADYHAINFEPVFNNEQRKLQGRSSKLFFFGPQLTQYVEEKVNPGDWRVYPQFYGEIKEVKLSSWGGDVYALIYDSTNDNVLNYDKVAFSMDKKTIFATLSEGEWGEWEDIKLKFKSNSEFIDVNSNVKVEVIKLDDNGFFRIRLFYNNVNEYITKPSTIAAELTSSVGPMVDFADNYPPQLIYYDEDKNAFLDESNMSLEWHKKAVGSVINLYEPDIVIHDIYTPNQMLTSRWWMGYLDNDSRRYNDIDEKEREVLQNEVLQMYIGIDKIVGEIMENADENTYIVLSSDHGAVPLDKWIRVNNLFAQKGWLKFTIDNVTGEPIIDWKNSKVIYLKMAHVYIKPEGLDGNWTRGSGENYEKLRAEVREELLKLEDTETGIKPITYVYNFEDVPKYLDLPIDRVGDLVILNEPGYGFNEEMSENLIVFEDSLVSGYKQAILPENEKGMWTPFIISGPGIKKNFKLDEPIHHVDQYPTIMKALNHSISDEIDGKILISVFE